MADIRSVLLGSRALPSLAGQILIEIPTLVVDSLVHIGSHCLRDMNLVLLPVQGWLREHMLIKLLDFRKDPIQNFVQATLGA